jgi:hypothetical protein
MASLTTPPDEILVRYLLGELPAAEADTLDERSIVDPDFFERLEAIENDLVDDYVRRELPADLAARFTRGYLTTAERAGKVGFASALAQRQNRTATVIPMKPRARNAVPWLLPLAATIAVIGLGLWFLPGTRNLPADAPATQQAAADAQPAPAPDATQPTPAPPVDAPPATVKETLFAFTLAAPRRGVDDPPSITIPAEATSVTLRAELEIDDFPRYRAILKDPATDRVLWRSSPLTPETQGASKVVPVMIPARHFDTRRYFLELEGVSAAGTGEPIATYAFRVVSPPAR